MIAGRSLAAVALLLGAVRCPAADWPTYRADASRSGYTTEPLPERMELRWSHVAAPPRPAWPNSTRITFDFAPQPIIVDRAVIFGSATDDRVTALDAETGRIRWTFFTGGPVRFAPAAWRDRIFVAGDDGRLVALALADGRVLWTHRGGPADRFCLGNERMISRWPARGGPVVVDDTVYYAAGVWPSEEIFLHALDAKTGAVRWTNDRAGPLYMPQPHGGANAHSGVSPQGYLAADGDRLFVPTGRAVPAAFCRASGELQHYRLQDNGSIGGARVLLAGGYVINGGAFLDPGTGALAARAGHGVFSVLPDGLARFTGSALLAYEWTDVDATDRKGRDVRYRGLKPFSELALTQPSEPELGAEAVVERIPGLRNLFRTEVVFRDADESVTQQTGLERTLAQARPDIERMGVPVEVFKAAAYERANEVIAAGDEAVCGSSGRVSIVNLRSQQVRWSYAIDGAAVGLAAANGRLVVSTTAGTIFCFAASSPDSTALQPAGTRPGFLRPAPAKAPTAGVDYAKAAEEILRTSGIEEGICVDLGCGEGQLALELVRRSRLTVIGMDDDPDRVIRAREMLAAAGVYGTRVSVHHADLSATGCPGRMANLVVSSRQMGDASVEPDRNEARRLQRPYGGVICLGRPGALEFNRRGPPEGAGEWTHQNADAANTLCSGDRLVRGPLEASWFRDGVFEIPDRHAQGPAPLFSRGVLVVIGVDGICGLDAYNGRTCWTHPIPGILADWDGVHHDVGVGDTGSVFCLGDDAVFVRTGDRCLKLDLATGRKLAEFRTPAADGAADRNWGFIATADGLLFGSVLNRKHTVSPRYRDISLRTESVLFFALDAATGEVKWTYRPRHSIRNNAIAIAGGRVYLIDRPLAQADHITDPVPNGKHRPPLAPGEHPGGSLMAIDAASGATVWITDDDVFGTQLAVHSDWGALLMYYQGVKHRFFKLPSEIGGRMAAFDTKTGARRWDVPAGYKTRPIILDDRIVAEGGAWRIEDGGSVPWTFERSYGCGQISAGRHLLLFRSATLGYLDLTRDAGVENFGGIRPGCWFNAIPAGGLVLVPDGSSKCACSYQMQAWIALQPMESPGAP